MESDFTPKINSMMKLALSSAQTGMNNGEVPVACVFATFCSETQEFTPLFSSHNETNKGNCVIFTTYHNFREQDIARSFVWKKCLMGKMRLKGKYSLGK